MGSGLTNFTVESTKHLLSTVIFPDFIYLYSRGDKMNKFSKPLNKINSTESYTRDMVLKINKSNMLALRINSTGSSAQVMCLKILPEPKHGLNMLQ